MHENVAAKQARRLDIANRAVVVLLTVFVALNLIPHATTLKEICFYGACLAFLYTANKTERILDTPLLGPLALLFGWSLFVSFFALNKANSIHDVFFHLLKYMIYYLLLVNAFKDRLLLLVWTVVLSTALFAVGLLFYYYVILGNDFSKMLGLDVEQVTRNIVGLATVFGIILSLGLFSTEQVLSRRLLLVVCLCGTLVATVCTQTRGALPAMVLALGILFRRNKKVVAVAAMLLLVFISLFPIKNLLSWEAIVLKVKEDDRVRAAYLFYDLARDYPLLGIGFGMETYRDENLLQKYNARVPAAYRQITPLKAPHNILIDVAVRTGIPGLLLFLYAALRFTRMGWETITRGKNAFIRHFGLYSMAAFAAWFTHSLLENTLSGPPAIILFTMFAMVTILWRMNKEMAGRSPKDAL